MNEVTPEEEEWIANVRSCADTRLVGYVAIDEAIEQLRAASRRAGAAEGAVQALREAADVMRKSGCADHAWIVEHLPLAEAQAAAAAT